MRWVCVLSVLMSFALASTHAQEKLPSQWDGPLYKPVDREAVHEFTRAPTVKKAAADRYEISFACKGNGDVAVAIQRRFPRSVSHPQS